MKGDEICVTLRATATLEDGGLHVEGSAFVVGGESQEFSGWIDLLEVLERAFGRSVSELAPK